MVAPRARAIRARANTDPGLTLLSAPQLHP